MMMRMAEPALSSEGGDANRDTAFLHLNSLATPGFRCAAAQTLAKTLRLITLAVVLATLRASMFVGTANCSTPETDGIVVEDLKGQPLNPFSNADAKAFLFIFVSVECPISNSYAPELNRLKAEFGPKGVVMKLVYPNK